MKIIFYGTRDYDHLYFDVLAADPDYGCTIKFLAANLDPDTAQLAAGGDAVCAFVNSDCGAETLSVLAKAGIKLLLMRCAGYNNVDLAAAKANGITVMRVPGYSPEAVAEHAMALLMELTRHAGALDMQVKQGDWDGADGFELFGKKLGIIGLGGIGQTVAGIANAFGMKVSAWNSHVPAQVFENLNVTPVEDMNELISNSDVVSVHMPLLDSTRGIITAKNLDALRPGTLFVNTARAEVIAALNEAAGILGICQISLVERLCDRISAEHIDTVEILRHVIGEIERRYQFVNRALRSPQCFFVGIPVGCIVCRPGIIQICEKNIIHNHDQSAPVRLTDPPGKIYNLFFFQNRPPFSCLIAPTAESAVPAAADHLPVSKQKLPPD